MAKLTEKVQTHAQDRSRHLLCPSCRVRTKLYTLKDGRKKCSACGTKFNPEKKTDATKLKQYADLLLCFCLNLTAKQASDMTGYHYRLASAVYDRFRMLLASQNLTPGKLQLLKTPEACDHAIHDSAFCRRCRSRFGCKGRKSGDSPIFGVKVLADNRIFIDPLPDDEASFRFDAPLTDEKRKFSAYAGFICRGKFHRFTDNERLKDGAERLWAWMSERLQKHHGIWKSNIGLYLKELEWKYNNRLLTSETQALKITELMPADFLVSWAHADTIQLDAAVPRGRDTEPRKAAARPRGA
ncbi:hypothetical protein HYZ99_05300 [Candidatus Peregrinibacteria bacterium]|nr:hypothetical protein [Candidatus Peregrinibacteria bacterium]